MSEWEWTTLGDIASSEGYGLVDGPFGSNLPASCYVESGIPVIRGSNLTLGTERFVADEFVYVSEETASRLERSLARPNDIVFTKKGTIGQTGLVPTDLPYEVYLISSNQMKLTVDESLADPIFVYYYVSSEASKNKIKKDSEFTGVPKTNTKYLREFPIYLPPLQKQHQIANILDSLDRKIENLRKQNETLEAIAQTLFKHWFVDFEFPNEDGKPYKSSGGAMERSELGDIPTSWRVEPLDEVANFLNGLALQNYPAKSDNFLPIIKIREMKSGITANTERASSEIPSQYVIDNGDVIFSWSGSLEIIIWCFGKGALNQHLFKVSSKKYPKWFYYFWNLEHLKHFRSIAKSKVTTMGHIQRKHLSEALCCVPNDSRLQVMNFTMTPILEKTIQNSLQIQTLAKTRDVLLPQLMSGKLCITE